MPKQKEIQEVGIDYLWKEATKFLIEALDSTEIEQESLSFKGFNFHLKEKKPRKIVLAIEFEVNE